MPKETCEYHALLVSDLAVTKNNTEHIKKAVDGLASRIATHVDEGEREGGFRDRLKSMESEISIMKKERWKLAITVGLIVGTMARSPDIWHLLINVFCKLAFAGQ